MRDFIGSLKLKIMKKESVYCMETAGSVIREFRLFFSLYQ